MTAGETTQYTLLWLIENYSFCCHNYGVKLDSPNFTPNGLKGTSWFLRVYPRGYWKKGVITLCLERCEQDAGPEEFPIRYELSLITADGLPLVINENTFSFRKKGRAGCSYFMNIKGILLQRNTQYLTEDTLRVRCRIWKDEENIKRIETITARTRIGIEKISFQQRAINFTNMKPNEKNTIQIRPQSKTGCVISSSIYFTENSFWEKDVIVEIVSSASNYVLCKQKVSLLNASYNIIECGEVDNRFDVEKKTIHGLDLSLTREIILKKTSEYLTIEGLALICECTFSTGVEFEKIVDTHHEQHVLPLMPDCKNKGIKDGYNAAENISTSSTVAEDMKAIYITQCLTDVELQTKTKKFPAHKVVLCARSSVFKAMLTNDMREKNTDCIQVDDLEDHIVQQFLLFLYSDNLENLQWESAIKLYYAGDKYAIEKLKVLCSKFLVDNVNTSTACELLLLADTHNDSDLKTFVEDFILKHKEQIIDSEEWKNLEETNPRLIIKTMYLMVKGKK